MLKRGACRWICNNKTSLMSVRTKPHQAAVRTAAPAQVLHRQPCQQNGPARPQGAPPALTCCRATPHTAGPVSPFQKSPFPEAPLLGPAVPLQPCDSPASPHRAQQDTDTTTAGNVLRAQRLNGHLAIRKTAIGSMEFPWYRCLHKCCVHVWKWSRAS